MFSGNSRSRPYGLPSTWSSIHFSSVRTDSAVWPVAPSTPKPPARLTAATTSRQWLKANRGNSIPSISQTGDFMAGSFTCGSAQVEQVECGLAKDLLGVLDGGGVEHGL